MDKDLEQWVDKVDRRGRLIGYAYAGGLYLIIGFTSVLICLKLVEAFL